MRLEGKRGDMRHVIEQKGLDVVSLITADLNGIARGKMIPARKLLEGDKSPIRLSSIVSMLDYGSMPFPPPAGDKRWWPSWAEGYSDTRGVIDESTFRLTPWLPGAGLAIVDFEHVDGRGLLKHMPRATLRRLVDRLRARGFETRAAAEVEFMLFAETETSAASKGYQNLSPLWPASRAYGADILARHDEKFRALRNGLEAFSIPVEALHVEAGPGQLEITVPPSDALSAADQCFLLKYAIKGIAAQQGLLASFVPKLTMAGFGNGNHLNFSLWKGGKNAFFDGGSEDKRSKLMKHFIGGIVSTLREFTLLYAPSVVAYRRFVPYYSPGMVVGWGYDNKSVAVRTVAENDVLTRIEQRTAGADVNPYVMMAACIAAGLYGIENEIAAPPPVLGDAYSDAGLLRVPTSIDEAIELFSQSRVANEYLGEDFVRFFAHGRRTEAERFRAATEGHDVSSEVSDWERARYFEVA